MRCAPQRATGEDNMFQVTAIYQDCEVGYGEADSLQYAIEECALSIDGFYRELGPEDFTVILLGGGTRTEISGAHSRTFRETFAVV